MTEGRGTGSRALRGAAAAALGVAVLVTAGPGLAQPAAADPAAPARPAASDARKVMELGTGWRFLFGDVPDSVRTPEFDDSRWEQVSLPHSWNRMGNYAPVRAEGSDVRQGTGWYRMRLGEVALPRGKRAILQFDGVGAIADLWVNGQHVGQHKGAFSRFRFDISDHLKPGQANIIVVRADNSKPEKGSSTEHVIPLGGDFFIHGGLYRGVSLIEVDAASIDLMDHGGPGIYVSTPSVTPEKAEVAVLTRLRNSGQKARKLAVVTRIADADGRTVASASGPARRLGPGETSELTTPLSLTNPRLWQGRSDPYLYSVTVELRDGARVIDSVTEPLGVRSFAWDADQGFILNGKPMRLHGASRHQDWQGKGWALTAEDHATDMAIMAEMGVNTVRHAHYQHAQEWSDLADRNGMVVKAELPFVHQSAFDESLPAPELVANARQQLLELIRQNYNHPSIMLWSVGNEIDIGAAIAALMKGGKGAPAKSRDMLVELNALAKQEDSTRPTLYADCCEGTPSPLARPGAQVLNDITDVVGLNRYFGWYYGQPQDLSRALTSLRSRYPDRPMAVTEYGAGGAFSQHTDNPLGGPVNANGRPHPEEFQAWVHEQNWKVLKQANFLSTSWIWNMFDFASTSREEGEAYDLNDKGLVSYDRKTRKDAFYFYKAQWSEEPVLHLTGRRYIDRAYPVLDVRAYSNAPRASLTVNGQAIGTVDCPDRICVWPGVRLRAGDNQIAASAERGGKALTDSLTWTAPDSANGLHVRAGHLTGQTTSAGLRFGSDNFFTGGKASELRMAGRTRIAPSNVTGTTDPELYASYRQGAFTYDLPLPDGRWTVTLHLFEPETDAAKAAARSMTVRANGKPVLTGFNPAKAGGGSLKAVTHRFDVTSSGGLKLDFSGGDGGAVVSAISVSPAR
ncbi:beta-galactosidase [Blastomonas natatoria]|uniref:Beta-galactosidase n=1 Tax=Blastomonas natatoria TaxID=34015 RepID=A0A2V3V792_9SPHN|nr:glycoside hydrolase family 2 TIM barrel-domain containing protein [Blastomonas natatoria]PXW77547.1 beta-galactosidase [Blastomonas natatoria]